MSLHLPPRRILGIAPTILKTLRPTLLTPSNIMSQLQVRHRVTRGAKMSKEDQKTAQGVLDKFEERKAVEDKLRSRMMAAPLNSQSIFGEEMEKVANRTAEEVAADEQKRQKKKKEEEMREAAAKDKTPKSLMGASLMNDHLRSVVDPDPRSRLRWERKMVIRHVTRALDVKGGETKQERIKRTERELLSKSPWIATSYKKLMYLARQISGKTLGEARLQMKMSRKKHAAEVLYQLDLARDTAIVERGMGLGRHNGEYVPGETEKKRIKDHRQGKFIDVVDPTRMYIDEAWVNRGRWRGIKPSFRARGRVDLIKMPQASISIRLKEEKTRLRLAEERKEKEYKKGPWIHLPDRPITAQRPFYCW